MLGPAERFLPHPATLWALGWALLIAGLYFGWQSVRALVGMVLRKER